jgi:hypothetical protein
MNGLQAFKEAFMSADTLDATSFSSFEARQMRYQIYWAYYESSAYDNVHKWANLYKAEYGLYTYVRNIYNPAYRLGEFWKSHLMGGALDPEAGDGGKVPSALPIVTENENVRRALAQLWKDSNWQIRKDIFTLYGTIMGDVSLKVIDDTVKGKVYLEVVHPGTLKELTVDAQGNVKQYIIEEQRPDPDNPNRMVVYDEKAERDGENVVYRLYKNNQPYAWGMDSPEWSEPYGFIPMIFVKHNDIGLDWGWSELHPAAAKFREVDDQASKLSDYIRKMVDAPFLFTGVDNPAKKKQGGVATSGADNILTPTPGTTPQPGREELKALWGPLGADAKPLVATLDVASTTAYIKDIIAQIEADFPELSADLHNVQGDISGRALRINRAPAQTKALQRRPNYDNGLVRAQQMALSIGGLRGYEGYQGFNLGSFDAGDEEHSIGPRPVFDKDPLDDLELEEKLWTVAALAKNAGYDLPLFLERQGWSQEDISKLTNSEAYKLKMEAMKMATTVNKNQPAGNMLNRKPNDSQQQGEKNNGK